MAGSLQKFIYVGDSIGGGVNTGRARVVTLDESNSRAVGAVPATAAAVLLFGIPATVEKLQGNERYILLSGQTSAGKPVTRRIIVPTQDNTFFNNGGAIVLPVLVDAANGTVENISFQVTLAKGEERKFANFIDTGLDDGSQP